MSEKSKTHESAINSVVNENQYRSEISLMRENFEDINNAMQRGFRLKHIYQALYNDGLTRLSQSSFAATFSKVRKERAGKQPEPEPKTIKEPVSTAKKPTTETQPTANQPMDVRARINAIHRKREEEQASDENYDFFK